MPEFGIHLIYIFDHPNKINCMLRPLMKPEANFLSYWSRILFLLFAVRGRQFCIMQDNINKINYHLKVWPCTSAKLIGSQFGQMVSKIQEYCTICTNSCEGLKLVSKMALKKFYMNFRLEHFVGRNRSGLPSQMLIHCLH